MLSLQLLARHTSIIEIHLLNAVGGGRGAVGIHYIMCIDIGKREMVYGKA